MASELHTIKPLPPTAQALLAPPHPSPLTLRGIARYRASNADPIYRVLGECAWTMPTNNAR